MANEAGPIEAGQKTFRIEADVSLPTETVTPSFKTCHSRTSFRSGYTRVKGRSTAATSAWSAVSRTLADGPYAVSRTSVRTIEGTCSLACSWAEPRSTRNDVSVRRSDRTSGASDAGEGARTSGEAARAESDSRRSRST